MKIAEYLETSVLAKLEADIKQLEHSISDRRGVMEQWADALKKEEALLEEAMEIRAKLLKIIDFCYSW